jgi:integrase
MPILEQLMPHALHQYVIADGKITLYQRDDVKDGIWQCRMTIKGNRGYVRRSTGETNLEKAKEVSLQILGELKQRKAQNLPMTRKTFAEVAAGYLRDAQTRLQEGRNSAGRYAIIKGTVNRYLVPYFANRDIALIVKKDLMDYRAWRQSYWITGPGRAEIKRDKKPPTQATLKQEWTVLRGVFLYGMDIGAVSQELMRALKHEKTVVNKRPAFTGQEYRQLYLFMRGWAKKSKNPRVARDRALLREYVLIMTNSGMRKGEARNLKWRDVSIYRNQHGEWVTLTVKGKTGERLVVCQPDTQQYFNRLKQRGYKTEPDDLVFCHEDGLPIENWVGFSALLKAAGLEYDTHGNKRSIYSLRHTYATFRLQHGTNVYWLKKNMGTSVAMIERHYGQTNVLIGIEHETAKRKKAPRPDNVTEVQHKPLRGKKADELVPMGAVDLTPAEQDGDED